jgi:hypothetical protein
MASQRRLSRKNKTVKRGGKSVITNIAVPVALVAANTLIKGKKAIKSKKNRRFSRFNKRR